MRTLYRFRVWHGIVGAVAVIAGSATAYDHFARYNSWANLSKAELVESANWYISNRGPGNDACLYAVTCYKGTARLELVKDLESWDLDAAKQLAWDRRFNNHCSGATANFALEIAPGGEDPSDGRRRAVWSFHLDRFTPRWGRFHGFHAFSQLEAEPCTTDYVITGADDAKAASYRRSLKNPRSNSAASLSPIPE